MACTTLKRSLEFDPVHNPKRRRCSPMAVSPNFSPDNQTEEDVSPFAEVQSKMTPENISTHIREEMRRLQHRKQLSVNTGQESPCCGLPLTWNIDPATFSSTSSCLSSYAANMKEKPLFTPQQVVKICEHLLKEQENQLREDFERVLHMKLSEQHEAFVAFVYDQLYKRFDPCTLTTYLS